MIQEAVMKTQISNDILTVSTSAYNGELTSIKTGDGVEYLALVSIGKRGRREIFLPESPT